MEGGKARGEFASAYKLSRPKLNNKAQRRERRSIEQKEFRHVGLIRQRNLQDLSPLQEGDQTVNKSYKGKTPVKVKEKKGVDRLEQLKKWREEREKKKTVEKVSTKSSVFKVGKLEHKETHLFAKGPFKKHQVRPQPVPKQDKVPEKPAVVKTTAPLKTAKTTNSASRSRNASGSRNTCSNKSSAATLTRSRGQTQQATRGVSSSRETRSKVTNTAEARKPAHTTRASLAKNKKAESTVKSSKQPKTLVDRNAKRARTNESPTRENHAGDFNETRITRRGEENSFAPEDFTFSATSFASASYMFQPLSPNSANMFLNAGQDNSCSSFLMNEPGRISTPKTVMMKKKKADADRTLVQEITVVASEKSANESSLRRSSRLRSQTSTYDQNSLSVSVTMSATPCQLDQSAEIFQADIGNLQKPEIQEPHVETETTDTTLMEQTIEEAADSSNQSVKAAKPTPRTSLRRSILLSHPEQGQEQGTKTDEGKVPSSPKSARRRSSRRSVVTSYEEENQSIGSALTPGQSGAGKTRRSVAWSPKVEPVPETTSLESETVTPSQQTRKSKRRSVISRPNADPIIEEKTEANTTPKLLAATPGNRRSSRRSIITDIPESSEEADVAPQASAIPFVGPPPGEDTSDIGNDDVFNDSLKENVSPRPRLKTPKHIRNKSFGGFRIPDSHSAVLSGRRSAKRKSMMPKSPEEWVEVLKNSPMVEMKRRKSKFGDMSLPILNYDEDILDSEEAHSILESPEETAQTDQELAAQSSSKPTAISGPGSPVFSITEAVSSMDSERDRKMSGRRSSAASSPCRIVATTPASKAEAAITASASTVQVGEVSSTQGNLSDDNNGDSEYDVLYFRNLLVTEKTRLNNLCDVWNGVMEGNPSLTEEVTGQIRTTVGKANLLMNQRFKQFTGLVDACEFKTGEKETTCTDLKGFWDMVYIQVEDVDGQFQKLTRLQDNNWIDTEVKPVTKKVVKKKVSKPVVTKPVKSKFAAFRAQMIKKKEEKVSSPKQVATQEDEEKVFEMPGFFTVASPVRTPKFHCDGGTPKKTPTASTNSNPSSSSTLTVPSSLEQSQPKHSACDLLTRRTPSRKSYAPAVPSPLLLDTTPAPRPVRSCTQRTPVVPKRLLDEEDDSVSDSKRLKLTPARGLRTRKSVNFMDVPSSVESPRVEGTDEDFAILLQPTMCDSPTTQASPVRAESNEEFLRLLQPSSPAEPKETPDSDDVFSKYLQPQDSPAEKPTKRRHSSLKSCRSTDKRRSRSRSVHFAGGKEEELGHMKLPHTPYNRDSLVKTKRTSRRSSNSKANLDDIFSIDNIDNDENIPPPSFRSARPSLLGTPPDIKKGSRVNRNVPTATLISFTP
ncbi:dentin sialophosphoprotein-like [Mya arenaria]|uniref:dentin sialophosphoprotein-like n=1 Tax=Mya arenaria TaxID=6604 RepID=UPI0022E43532|nr:dentin sialophosphoprotein-like [Mya arenaria]XP_052776248.1 dentin sialophosphoprotein-like [Mya arenaria]